MTMFNNEDALDDRTEVKELFRHLQAELPALEKLLAKSSGDWGYEDPMYRFYHQSFKVYSIQKQTQEIVEKLQTLAPNLSLNKWFMRIVKEGTGKTFDMEDNKKWLKATRPMVEAFFHARYFLEMAVKYGKELKHPPQAMPGGWAALLYLYDLR